MKKVWRITFNGDCSLEASSRRNAELQIQKLLDHIENVLVDAGLEVYLLENEVELFQYSLVGEDDEDTEE